MKYIERHAYKTLKRLSSEFPVVLITGARQTGKTTLLKKYTDKHKIKSLTFDDPMEEISAKTDPATFISLHMAPYMFDEIQYIPELFRYLKIEIDKDRKEGMFYLTGSQQFNLMEKATESLAGRVGIIALYGLSAREITGDEFDGVFLPDERFIKERTANLEQNKKNIWQMIFEGGYPEVINGHIRREDFYASYIKTYIERDIKKLTQVADELTFIRFIGSVAARTGNIVNYNDIAKDVGISETTVKKWLSLLVTSGLVYLLKPFSMNVEKRVIKTPKLYFMDTGLASYLTGWSSPEVMLKGAMAGNFYETYVISEIIKSYANAGEEAPIYFYRDKDKIEIDLIIYKDNTIYPIEIKKTGTPSPNDARNFHITQRIKGVNIASPVIICSTSTPVIIKDNVMALPVEYI